MADALDVVTVVLAGLMAGGLLVVEVGLVQTIRRLSAATGVRLHVAFDHYVEWSMPPLTIATFGVGLAALVSEDHVGGAELVLRVVALVAAVAVAGVSQLVNVPLNARMRTWGPRVPDEYESMRRRWDRAHRVRTLAGQVAFVCFAVAFAIG